MAILELENLTKRFGNSPLTDVALSLSPSNSNIGVEALPLKVSLLKPNEYQTFTVTVTAPQGLSTGDYVLTMEAASREITAATGTKTIRLTVAAPENITLIAGGLVVCLVGVGLLVRRFRRT